MIDIITQKINDELTRQSKKIYNSSHALHLLETVEMFDFEDLKTKCYKYIKIHLSSLWSLERLLEGRSFSLKTEMKIKEQLFKNILELALGA